MHPRPLCPALALALLLLAPAAPLVGQAAVTVEPPTGVTREWLEVTRAWLEQPAQRLATIGTGNFGGSVERARADVAAAIAAVERSTSARQSNPALAQPAHIKPNLAAIYRQLAYQRPSGVAVGVGTQQMFDLLPPLKRALDSLQNVPDRDREAIVIAIGDAAGDIVAGIRYADGLAAERAAASAANRVSAALAPLQVATAVRAPESARQRLVILQANLRLAIASLKQMPPGGFADTALDSTRDALAATADALAYIEAHPEAELPPADTVTVAVPYLNPPGNRSLIQRNTQPGSVAEAYPSLPAALDTLLFSLRNFLSGAPGTPTIMTAVTTGARGAAATAVSIPTYSAVAPGPVIGPLGGHRDRILRHTGTALNALILGVYDVAYRDSVPMAPGETEASARPSDPAPPAPTAGAIAGRVFDYVGDPAANVLIGLAPMRRPGFSGLAADTPMTLTAADGSFAIRDVPPGSYRLTTKLVSTRPQTAAGAGALWIINSSIQVEVRPAAETKLLQPIVIR